MKIIVLILISVGILMASFERKGVLVYDTKLNLIWQDNNATKTTRLNYPDAQKYCKNLSLEGKNDWRLPSIQELQSIIDFTRYKPAINKIFKNSIHRLYWSSTLYSADKNRAWYVFFYDGRSHYYLQANDSYVRCIRDKN